MKIIKIEKSSCKKCLNGEIRYIDYMNELVKKKGYKDYYDYKEKKVRMKGYKNYSDYIKQLSYKKGEHLPMDKNIYCAPYLGIYIAENVLTKIFENVQKMPNNNEGYDFICKNGYKIDVKSSCLRSNNVWSFNIRENEIADYFLLIAFDNRENLIPLHIWLIKSGEAIRNKKFNNFILFDVYNDVYNAKSLIYLEKYEIVNKLEDIKSYCDNFKSKVSGTTVTGNENG